MEIVDNALHRLMFFRKGDYRIVNPVIKWAGGKKQLLNDIRELAPKAYNRYFEPFIGGGAVLLELKPPVGLVNDINPELVNLYVQLRDNPDDLIKKIKDFDIKHEKSSIAKDYYYSIRESFNNNLGLNTVEQAARLIYLNKHCFNGLYRVNSKGKFNVPFNNRLKGASFVEDNLRDVSSYLKGIEIKCGDFENAVSDAKCGDFVFFDSPYVPINPMSFTDYTKEGFDYSDHVRLAELYKKLSLEGIKCMLTNHNTELVRDLYSDYKIKVVKVSRNINSDASNRKGEEVIITNYEL